MTRRGDHGEPEGPDDQDLTLPPTPVELVTPRPAPPRRTSPLRWLVPLFGLLLVVAVAAEAISVPPAATAAAEVEQDPAAAGIWYCPVTAEPEQSAVVSIAATGTAESEVVVVRHTSEGVVGDDTTEVIPGGHQFDVVLEPAEAQQPVSVRWSGGPAIATWRTEGDAALVAPCASGPAPVWYLAGLDTANGSRSTLHLFNPFNVDAVARITFTTPDGPDTLVSTDSELVPAGTSRRIDIATDLQQPEVADLGVIVEVRSGRLVAQGEVRYEPAAGQTGPIGRTLVPAAEAPAEAWAFGFAQADEQSSSWLSIMNPGEREAAVEIQVSGDQPTGSELLDEVSVPAGGTYRVPLADSAASAEFGVEVLAVNDVPVVATRTTSLVAADDRRGVATSLGAAPAQAWALAGAGTDGRASFVDIYNPGPTPVTASMSAGPGTPDEWGAIEVGVNQRVSIDLAEVGDDAPRISLTVSADNPIVAELRSTRDGDALRSWTTVGVPAARYTGALTRPPVHRDPGLSTRPLGQPEEEG